MARGYAHDDDKLRMRAECGNLVLLQRRRVRRDAVQHDDHRNLQRAHDLHQLPRAAGSDQIAVVLDHSHVVAGQVSNAGIGLLGSGRAGHVNVVAGGDQSNTDGSLNGTCKGSRVAQHPDSTLGHRRTDRKTDIN